RLAAGTIEALPTSVLDGIFGWLGPTLSRHGRQGSAGDKLKKAARVMRMESADDLYRSMVGHWRRPEEIVRDGMPKPTSFLDPATVEKLPSFLERMIFLDQVTYLPDDILTKVDRASMAHALEARVPLLDHEVVALAWRLPMALKRRDGEGKWILRQVLSRHVPAQLFDRPKMGFGVPVGDWLKGPLKAWAEDLLSEDRLRRQGFLHPGAVRRRWAEHLEGRRNWQYHLWDVLMFQAWLDA
ncbi:MAG: asparagine synthetase B, partial [Acidobacteria bacterium]|nr:asparagine synthetase B [Acidobacteriota bacterium]